MSLQGWSQLKSFAIYTFPLSLFLTAQLRGIQGQSSEQQPGVVVDVGLDKPVTVADSYGDHGIHGDAMGG